MYLNDQLLGLEDFSYQLYILPQCSFELSEPEARFERNNYCILLVLLIVSLLSAPIAHHYESSDFPARMADGRIFPGDIIEFIRQLGL